MDPAYRFIDIVKQKNYIAFESGVICFFPNFYPDWTEAKDYGCEENQWFFDTYYNIAGPEECVKNEGGNIVCKISYANGTTVECENDFDASTAVCCLEGFVEGELTGE